MTAPISMWVCRTIHVFIFCFATSACCKGSEVVREPKGLGFNHERDLTVGG